MRRFLATVAVLGLAAGAANAQAISFTGSTLTQDFDSLINTGTGSFVNDSTLDGWYVSATGSNGSANNNALVANAGSGTTGSAYSYGTGTSTDRALGTLRSGTFIPTIGIQIAINTSGLGISDFTVAYKGEEWRLGTASRTDSFTVEYSTNATSLSTGTWTAISGLNFTTPNTATVGAKDGNATGNFTDFSPSTTTTTVNNGTNLWIRFVDNDATGADDGLAVDDFSFSASVVAAPEPGTLALLGLALPLVGGVVIARRRKQAK